MSNLSKNLLIDKNDIINEIEKYPIIYNKDLGNYHNSKAKAEAWNEVCQNVISEWNNLTAEEKMTAETKIKKTWSNIRNCFVRELRFKRDPNVDHKRRKSYYFFKNLMFLLPFVELNEDDKESLTAMDIDQSDAETSRDNFSNETNVASETASTLKISFVETMDMPETKKFEKRVLTEMDLLKELHCILYKFNNVNEALNKPQNEFDFFGKYIAAALKDLPFHAALQVQREIQNLLIDFKLKFLADTSDDNKSKTENDPTENCRKDEKPKANSDNFIMEYSNAVNIEDSNDKLIELGDTDLSTVKEEEEIFSDTDIEDIKIKEEILEDQDENCPVTFNEPPSSSLTTITQPSEDEILNEESSSSSSLKPPTRNITFGRTQTNTIMLMVDGYCYIRHTFKPTNGKEYWTCDCAARKNCPARGITTDNRSEFRETREHNHLPDVFKNEWRRMKDMIKQWVTIDEMSTNDILNAFMMSVSDQVKEMMPKKASLQKYIQRHKRKIQNSKNILRENPSTSKSHPPGKKKKLNDGETSKRVEEKPDSNPSIEPIIKSPSNNEELHHFGTNVSAQLSNVYKERSSDFSIDNIYSILPEENKTNQ